MLFGKAIEIVEMVVEDSGKLDMGLEQRRREGEWYKWRLDGKLDCEEYQESVQEEFIG